MLMGVGVVITSLQHHYGDKTRRKLARVQVVYGKRNPKKIVAKRCPTRQTTQTRGLDIILLSFEIVGKRKIRGKFPGTECCETVGLLILHEKQL